MRDFIAGVVQGSVLGPILFLLYVLDINEYLPSGVELVKYADDILAYIVGYLTVGLPQDIVDAVQRWCVDNRMHLNVGKCKVICINPSSSRIVCPAAPTIYLLGQMLEIVKFYKYLGFELSDSLDPVLQWVRVRSIVSPFAFLLKQLKLNGWSTSMLVNAYRAYCLSHFRYSAVMLTSVSAAVKKEMDAFNARLWRIMGVNQQTASSHKLLPISEFIDNACEQTLIRILADPKHPVTLSLPRNLRMNARFPFQTRRANKVAYSNSFLQKFLRKLRNDTNNQSARASLYMV